MGSVGYVRVVVENEPEVQRVWARRALDGSEELRADAADARFLDPELWRSLRRQMTAGQGWAGWVKQGPKVDGILPVHTSQSMGVIESQFTDKFARIVGAAMVRGGREWSGRSG